MYWMIDEQKYIIQGINEIDITNTNLPIGIKTNENTSINVSIESLKFVPDDTMIYLKDNELNTYHDLKQCNYSTVLQQSETNERFEIVFSNQDQTLANDNNFTSTNLNVYYKTSEKALIILNQNKNEVKSLKLVNVLGQVVLDQTIYSTETYIKTLVNLSEGVYFATVNNNDIEITKKIIINN